MRAYIARRILLFVPTLLLIILVVFGVVNAAPTAPPPIMDGKARDAQREAYRLFREQFSLHLPVFLNLRHRLTTDEIVRLLERSIALDTGAGVKARDRLEDLREYSVAALVEVANDPARSSELRDIALRVLPIAARRPVAANETGDAGNERRSWNDEVALLRPASEAVSSDERSHLASAWSEWLEVHRESYQFGFGEIVSRTFFDTRFATFLSRLARLDFGRSMSDRQPVLPTLVERLKRTLVLTLVSIAAAYLLAVPLGALIARRQGSWFDRVASLLLFALYSLPTFFVASLLHRYFTLGDPFDWFPIGGLRSVRGFDEMTGWEQWRDRLHHSILPIFCLTYGSLAVLSRYARASTIDALRSDYIRTARAKGLAERDVLFRHALRNALPPILTLLGNVLPAAFGGAVIVEYLFDIKGMGSFIYESILGRDYNAILATTLISAVLTLIGYLISDLLRAAVDPRVSLEEEMR